MCRDKSGFFKVNEVVKIDEDVIGDIKGCLSTLKVRLRIWRSVTADLKLFKMAVIYILGIGYIMRTNVIGRD